MTIDIVPFTPNDTDAVLDLTIAAWDPVFARTAQEVPRFVYDAFYPNGWDVRLRADVAELLKNEDQTIQLARAGAALAGFVGICFHPEDRMGEVSILAVAPAFQRQGVATRLLSFAEDRVREAGMDMLMVETVGDNGHARARRAYEAHGFEPWPVARYFKRLRSPRV